MARRSKDLVSMIPLRERGKIAHQAHRVQEVVCPAIFQRPHLVAKNLGVFNWEELAVDGSNSTVCFQYVWATVDNCLYIWEISSRENSSRASDGDGPVPLRPALQCSQLDQLDQAITAVHLCRAKDGVFPGRAESPYILVVATTVDIILFQVERNRTRRTLQPTPTDFFTSSDHVSMTKIVSSKSGRIFMSGADGFLYELEYRRATLRDRYLNGNCSEITCTKTRVVGYEKLIELLPPFVGALFLARRDIIDMCYDEEDDAIFVLMMNEATVRRISLRGEAAASTATGKTSSSSKTGGGGAAAAPRVPRAMFLLDREHPFRRANPLYKLAVVMQDGEVVYVTMQTKGGKRALSVGTAAASNRQTSTLGVMVALPFSWKQTMLIATTKPADGPLNRLQFVTALPCRQSKGSHRSLEHVVATEGAHERPIALLGKVYHIDAAENHDATAVEQLYWHFKTTATQKKRKAGASGAAGSGDWDEVDVHAHIQRCSNGKYAMEYCPDPLLRFHAPEFVVVGESRVQRIAMLRLLDERLALEERGNAADVNEFIRTLLRGSKTHHANRNQIEAARDYICILLIILCCGGSDTVSLSGSDSNQQRRSRTWAHLRDLFTHNLFRSEDKFTTEAEKFKRGQFAEAVQVFIAQVLYRVSSIPFAYFTSRGASSASFNGRVPERVLDRLISTLDRLLELLIHPNMFELKRNPPQADDFSFREEFPNILNFVHYLIQFFKFLRVVNEAGRPRASLAGSADTAGLRGNSEDAVEAEHAFNDKSEAFFKDTILDLLDTKEAVRRHCHDAIMAAVADLSHKGLDVRELEDLVRWRRKYLQPRHFVFAAAAVEYYADTVAAIDSVVQESDFALRKAATFAGDRLSSHDRVFRDVRDRTDFSFESLEDYCEKLYNKPSAGGLASGASMAGAGSPKLRIQVAREMLRAAKQRGHPQAYYEYVRGKLFSLAKDEDPSEEEANREVFLGILDHAEQEQEDDFLRKYVYGPFLATGERVTERARDWILRHHEICTICDTRDSRDARVRGACCLRKFAWDQAELLRYLSNVKEPNPRQELGEWQHDGTNEPLLVTFCKLPTSNLDRRLEDQLKAAELLRRCARTETHNIDVRVRVQCLRSALGRLQDRGNMQ